MLKQATGILLATIIVVLAFTAESGAQCGTELSGLDSSDFELFGQRSESVRSWAGQLFTTDCDGQFLRARVRLYLDGGTFNGVPSLATGDPVTCTVMDAAHQPIATVTHELTFGFGYQWVEFDFEPLGIGLAAGVLGIRFDTPGDKYGFVSTGADLAPGNLLVGVGANTYNSASRDAAFGVFWDPGAGVVKIEEHSWGRLKALYR